MKPVVPLHIPVEPTVAHNNRVAACVGVAAQIHAQLLSRCSAERKTRNLTRNRGGDAEGCSNRDWASDIIECSELHGYISRGSARWKNRQSVGSGSRQINSHKTWRGT